MISENSRLGIVTGGTWCADHNKLVERWPGEEELVKIISEEVRGGGSACNLGIDIKRLDPQLPVATIGLLGNDADGKALLQQATDEGLDTTGLHSTSEYRTTFTDAYTSKASARRTHLFHPGTSQALNPDYFDFSQTNARILHLGLPGLHTLLDSPWADDENGWVTVLKKARSAGLKTNLELCSLPPERLQELVMPCLAHLNYLIVNEFEIAAVAGRPTTHATDTNLDACISNAKFMLEHSGIELVVVHFPLGAIAVTADGQQFTSASVDVPSENIVGTNGAGDAFAAGALYGIHQNWQLEKTLKLAHAAAAASIRSISTTDALVGWNECFQLASQLGWRAPLQL